MSRSNRMIVTCLFASIAIPALPMLCAAQALTGNVKSSDGKPMEGVVVSARADGLTFTTNVYTDKRGVYAFPAALAGGTYKIWAQAVGFETARAELNLGAGKSTGPNLQLKPLKEFADQMSPEEWLASIPENSFKEKREKALFVNNCTACHEAGFPLQNRFDAKGWANIVDVMSKTGGLGAYQRNRVAFPIIQEYKDEFVSFLTRVRGPDSPPLKFKVAPRPTGDATLAIITEYDLPPGEAPDYFPIHNGTDWSQGTPSAYEGRSAHDIALDSSGNVWFTDQANPDRTIGKVDVKSGKVSGFKLARQMNAGDGTPSEDNLRADISRKDESVGSHGMEYDARGNLWFTNGVEGTLTKFDIASEKFIRFPRSSDISATGAYAKADSKGNVWSLTRSGVTKLDPKTGKYTEYKSVTPAGDHYGLSVDSEDNVWWTQMGKDRLGFLDAKTEKVSEVILPSSDLEVTAKDLDVASKFPASNISAPPQLKGPRRMGADPKGDVVWVAEFFADKLAKVDIHTKKITEYRMPRPYMQPYHVVVDKNHMVWICTFTDRLLRFDPSTEKFTEFMLPTRGTEPRFITVDNSTASPTIWVPYWRANKIAKIELKNPAAITQASR